MAFVKRTLDVTIKLKNGTFKNAGDTVTITGHRVNCEISKPIGGSNGSLHCVIYGLSLDLMHRLSAQAIDSLDNVFNEIQIAAGSIDADGVATQSVIYQGTITQAWADFSQMPTAIMQFNSYGAVEQALKPVNVSSYPNNTTVESIFFDLAGEAGLTLVNNGVSGQMENVYLSNTTLEKIRSLAKATNTGFIVDQIKNTLSIFPQESGFIKGDIPLISPKTGMIGYPTYQYNGLSLQTIFNPNVKPMELIEVQSQFPPANGIWQARDVTHTLEAESPDGNGAWFTRVDRALPFKR